jgi:hypothetical protein
MDITIETDSELRGSLAEYDPSLGMGKAATRCFSAAPALLLHQVNRDILYPLARTYYRWYSKTAVDTNGDGGDC